MGSEAGEYTGYVVGKTHFVEYWLDSDEIEPLKKGTYRICSLCKARLNIKAFMNDNVKRVCHKCMKKLCDRKEKMCE